MGQIPLRTTCAPEPGGDGKEVEEEEDGDELEGSSSDPDPTLHEVTDQVMERVAPELTVSRYSHATAWDLAQELIGMSMTEVMESARLDLGLGPEDEPVVGRVFGARPVADGVDELVEVYAAVHRSERVVIAVQIAELAE